MFEINEGKELNFKYIFKQVVNFFYIGSKIKLLFYQIEKGDKKSLN